MYAKKKVLIPTLPPRQALAWAAGFADGDGCIHIAKQTFRDLRRKNRPVYRLRLTISQSDLPVLQHWQRVVGITGCVASVNRTVQHNKQPYSLTYDGDSALAVIKKLYPFLVAKRAQAVVAFDFARKCRINQHPGPKGQPPRIWKLREWFYNKLRRMK